MDASYKAYAVHNITGCPTYSADGEDALSVGSETPSWGGSASTQYQEARWIKRKTMNLQWEDTFDMDCMIEWQPTFISTILQPSRIYLTANQGCAMGWADIVLRASGNYTKYVESNAISVKSTDFWHRLNATRQIKCTSVHYVAFNLPIVAFTLSGDPANFETSVITVPYFSMLW